MAVLSDADVDYGQKFFERVARHPLLSSTQERALATRAKAGDRSARDEMVRCNARLVLFMIYPYRNRGLSQEDLFQEGVVGLLRAIDKFEPARGFKFSTYATWWIRQAVSRAVANKADVIRVPSTVHDQRTAMRRHLSANPDATQSEIALAVGITEEELSDLLYAPRVVTGIHQEGGDGGDIVDMLADELAPDPADVGDGYAVLRTAVDDLPDSIRDVLRLRFGIDRDDPMSIVDVGRELGLPEHRVSGLQRQGLAMLRTALNRETV